MPLLESEKPRLLILYGSQTGNAQARQANRAACLTVPNALRAPGRCRAARPRSHCTTFQRRSVFHRVLSAAGAAQRAARRLCRVHHRTGAPARLLQRRKGKLTSRRRRAIRRTALARCGRCCCARRFLPTRSHAAASPSSASATAAIPSTTSPPRSWTGGSRRSVPGASFPSASGTTRHVARPTLQHSCAGALTRLALGAARAGL